jgi:hypothetical protein
MGPDVSILDVVGAAPLLAAEAAVALAVLGILVASSREVGNCLPTASVPRSIISFFPVILFSCIFISVGLTE